MKDTKQIRIFSSTEEKAFLCENFRLVLATTTLVLDANKYSSSATS